MYLLPKLILNKFSSLIFTILFSISVSANPAVVIENGNTIKVGFAGDSNPVLTFPAVVGYPRPGVMIKDPLIGDEALAKSGVLNLKYPVQNGLITNWDEMKLIWAYAFRKLGVSADAQPVFHSNSVFNPPSSQEMIVEIMFEQFNVPSLSVEYSPLTALYFYGNTSGTVVEMDNKVTTITAVYNGYALTLNATQTFPNDPLLSTHINNVIQNNDITIRDVLYDPIVLSGEGSMEPTNLANILQADIAPLAPSVRVRVLGSPSRQHASWSGAAILTSIASYDWITRAEYDSMGAAVVNY